MRSAAPHATAMVAMPSVWVRNGYRWSIHHFRAEDNHLIVTARVRKGDTSTSPIVIDTHHPANPMIMVDPISDIYTGEVTNPLYDPLSTLQPGQAGYQPPTLPVYVQDIQEAIRVMLDRHLAMVEAISA